MKMNLAWNLWRHPASQIALWIIWNMTLFELTTYGLQKLMKTGLKWVAPTSSKGFKPQKHISESVKGPWNATKCHKEHPHQADCLHRTEWDFCFIHIYLFISWWRDRHNGGHQVRLRVAVEIEQSQAWWSSTSHPVIYRLRGLGLATSAMVAAKTAAWAVRWGQICRGKGAGGSEIQRKMLRLVV